MSEFQGNSWKVQLPEGWLGEHDEECSTIYHPEGVGALQISSYSKSDTVTEADLKNMAQDHIDAGANLAKASAGEFSGFTLAFGSDGEFWQFWYVGKGNTALLLSYNCEEADLGPERDYAKNIVANLRAT